MVKRSIDLTTPPCSTIGLETILPYKVLHPEFHMYCSVTCFIYILGIIHCCVNIYDVRFDVVSFSSSSHVAIGYFPVGYSRQSGLYRAPWEVRQCYIIIINILEDN